MRALCSDVGTRMTGVNPSSACGRKQLAGPDVVGGREYPPAPVPSLRFPSTVCALGTGSWWFGANADRIRSSIVTFRQYVDFNWIGPSRAPRGGVVAHSGQPSPPGLAGDAEERVVTRVGSV